ncbi:MAG: ABC transporter permease [Coriobacteriia bacterium]|nr:ABC transporter permease [Coriobacteriia bacterium]
MTVGMPRGSIIERARAALTGARGRAALREWLVPAIFVGIAVIEYSVAGLPFGFVAGEVMTRIARDSLFTLALIVPIVAGLGLNFSVVIGALGGQIGLVVVNDLGIGGLPGLAIAVLIGVALGYLGGIAVAWCMERAPGREMIVGIILGFLADGIYRIVFMAGYGTVLPSHNPEMVLSRGIGLRDTVDFAILRRALDLAIPVRIGVLIVPVATLLVVALTAWLLTRLLRSRTGAHLRAVGLDPAGARLAGLDPARLKRFALIVSTVVASVGQVVWLQNIGMLQTYTAHRNVGFLAGAALLAGGATVRNARIRHALVGTAVFHTMFVLSPLAGQALTGSPAIGEFFRSFVTYGTIAVALVVTGWVEARRSSGDTLDERLDAGP